MDPVLDVIIVTSTGAREHIEACLGSLRRHTPEPSRMRVHIVDNASADGTTELVRERFPEVEIMALDTNTGFCHANNVGLAGSTAPYVLLLNPDTEATEPFLEPLIELMESRPDVGMCGCRLVLRDGSFDHAAKRSLPTPLSALAHFTGVGRRDDAPQALAQYRAPELPEDGSGQVDSVNGAFMLARRSAIDEVGGLDEGYWLYMEDLDWCRRFSDHGWKVWYEGAVSVIHVKGGTTVRGGHRGLRHNLAFHRSMGRFYRKHYAPNRNPLLNGLVYAGIGAKLAVSATRGALALRHNVGRRMTSSATGPHP